MQKLKHIFAVILFSTVSIQSMENYLSTRITPKILVESHQIFSSYLLHDKNQLISLDQTIRTLTRLRCVCTHFFTLFNAETIGKFCSVYNKQIKTKALHKVSAAIYQDITAIYKTNETPTAKYTYQAKKLYALLLIYAGADAQVENNALLKTAVHQNDIQFIDILLKHDANPYEHMRSIPIFWHARTTKMAQVFIDNKINLEFIRPWNNDMSWNILKQIITNDEYSSDLLELYLTHNVNATLCDPYGSCLLHTLARIFRHSFTSCSTHFLNKATLLLTTIPKILNTINEYNETPLDIAQETLEMTNKDIKSEKEFSDKKQVYFNNYQIYKKLITLFKKYGGFTTQELKEYPMIILLHNDDHLGDLSILPRDIRRYIVQYIDALHKQTEQ